MLSSSKFVSPRL